MAFRKKPARSVYTNYGTAGHHSRTRSRRRLFDVRIVAAALIVAAILFGGYFVMKPTHATSPTVSSKSTAATTPKTAVQTKPAAPKAVPAPKAASNCQSNTLSQLVLVSISKRRMWACAGSSTVYDSAVVTGMENLPADLTPTGTYHIYSKQRDLYLNGSDSTGSWHDYVYYWMPWLSNQYGVYGFHDATWRKASAFGNISPYSSNASHGCVELPLATAKWLYNWASVGTTVTIES
jgi:lipoprotein-anchoring transpeptidase ErfK/SrfK